MKIISLITLLSFSAIAAEQMSDQRANQIADAIFRAEGGTNTHYPYGIKSVKTSNPRKICINTIKNNYLRWQIDGSKGNYLDYLAARYCPKASDPIGHTNWVRNIHKLVK